MASYHDTARSKEEWKDEESRRENFYHGLVLGLLASLSPAYAVESNREYGEGRPDIVVVKKGNNPAQAEEAVLLEFKHGNAKDGKALEDLAREAHYPGGNEVLGRSQGKMASTAAACSWGRVQGQGTGGFL